MAALRAGDDVTAARDLSIYLQRYPNDADALAGFAHARIMIPAENGQNAGDAIVALRNLLKLQPQRIDDRRTLLGLYLKAGYLTEALDTADTIISQSGEDAEVMSQKSRTLIGLRRFDEALGIALRWEELSPNDFEAPLTVLWLMHQLQQPTIDISKKGEASLKSHPHDPEFEMVCAYSYVLCNDRKSAIKHLEAAAVATPANDRFATALVDELDAVGLYDESISVLQRVLDNGKLPGARGNLARRYWESGRAAEAAKLLESVSASDSTSPDDLLGLRALSLSSLKRDKELSPIRQAFAARHDSATAAAWSLVLDQLVSHDSVDPNRLLEACKKALEENPANAYISYFLGAAYAELGEDDLAINSWQKTTELDRTWPIPLLRMADALAQAGRFDSAMIAAQEAELRAPRNADCAIALARIWSVCIESPRYDQPARLLALVDQIQKEIPGEQESLVIRVTLLARSGKLDEARTALRAGVANKTSMSESTLLRLGAVSEAWKLGLEDSCFQRSLQENGITANLALAEARGLYGAGKPEEGLKLFEASRAKIDPNRTSLDWQMKRIGYLDLIQSPLASKEVVSLGDAYPRDVRVQRLVLTTFAARKERDFMERSIQRFRQLTGDQGVAWRVARGRWLLDFAPDQESTAEACALLTDATKLSPDLLEAHVLLAQAFDRAEKPNDAIDQLTIAADLSPGSTSIGLYLARLLQARGDYERAREQLGRVTAAPVTSVEQRRQAAVMLAQQGESQRAIELLEEANREANQTSSDLFLAQLYRDRNQPEKAEAICKRLLKEQPDLSVIQFYAVLLATQGRTEEADQVLSGLDTLKLESGVRDLALADFYARESRFDEALMHFRSAVQLAPKNSAAWKALIACNLASGKIADCLVAATDGLKQLPAEKSLQAIHANADLILEEAQDQWVRIFVGVLIRNPEDESVASESIRTIAGSRRRGDSPEQVAMHLTDLARVHPTFFPLQLMLAASYLEAGRFDDAIAAATRATQISPTQDEPYRILYRSYAETKRWTEALNAAQQWRDHSLSSPIDADLSIADSQMAMDKPAEALSILQPYLVDSKSAAYARVLPSYAQAQKLAGNSSTASLLEPLLKQGPAGRQQWILFALQNLSPGEAAVWLDRVSKVIPENAAGEQINLAVGWGELYERTHDANCGERVRSILEPIVASPQPRPEAVLTLGMFEEQAGNQARAELLYRQVLKMQADSVIAQNNLAMLLVRQNKALDEAHNLAVTALKAHPGIATLYDTLAEVEMKEKIFTDAIENMKNAVKMQPNNLTYRITLVKDLEDAGEFDEARVVLKEVDDLNTAKLEGSEKEQLDGLHKLLGKT
ncbi:MAG: tetratricopeptide repeat protein [Planctomycetota bacterium]|nr:tetratricopeptide repeat protein [Planctomycetota bacterium]